MNPPLDFVHQFAPGTSGRTLLLLHGTGGTEADMIPLGRQLDPTAALLSPRGKSPENGRPRFFRRLAEGIFDEKDLIFRTHELADFVGNAATNYGFDPKRVVAVGYSNGANIAGALLLLRPEILAGAALLRPMVPIMPAKLPKLDDVPVLIAAGNEDPIVPAENAQRLEELLRRSGAKVESLFEDAGHRLTNETVETTKLWLARIKA
jgi:predicted esterase